MTKYVVWWTGLPNIKTTVDSETVGKAKYHVFKQIKDSGWVAKFTQMRARKLKEYQHENPAQD